jgi:hypothetical protein
MADAARPEPLIGVAAIAKHCHLYKNFPGLLNERLPASGEYFR